MTAIQKGEEEGKRKSKETLDKTDAIMRKLHNLPGAVDDEPVRVSALAH